MRRNALFYAPWLVSTVLIAVGCGRAHQPPALTPVAVRVEALLPLHPAWRDYLALTANPSTVGAAGAPRSAFRSAALSEMPPRLVYEVPPAPASGPEPLASSDRIDELRPRYEALNAAIFHSALRQRMRELEAVRGPIGAALARSDALADALYASQWNEQVAPIEARILALQSQLDLWSSDKAVRDKVQPEIDRLRTAAANAEARLKLDLALRRSEGAQRVIDARDREAEDIRQELVLLEAERNAEVGRRISGYKLDVARSRQSIQPLTNTVVPRPVVVTPPELRAPPHPVIAQAGAGATARRAPTQRIEAASLLSMIRRDIERRVNRAAQHLGWRVVTNGADNVPDRTDAVRRILLAQERS